MTCLGTEPGKKAFMLVRLAGLILILLMAALTLAQNEPGGMLELHGSIRQVHDPVLISEAGRYYLYSTGTGIPVRCSDDMLTWELCSMVFSQLPDWARTYVPGVTQVWAPDISFFSGRYHLYYSLSTFGSNVSAIGLATNSTLDPNSPEPSVVRLVNNYIKEWDWFSMGVPSVSTPERTGGPLWPHQP